MIGLIELYKFEEELANNDLWSNEIEERIRSVVFNKPRSQHTLIVGETVKMIGLNTKYNEPKKEEDDERIAVNKFQTLIVESLGRSIRICQS